MKNLFVVLIIFNLLVSIKSTIGVDINTPKTSATFTCFKNNKNSFAVISATNTNGNLDTNAIQTLQNARLAKISTDIYITPCRGKDPSEQVNSVLRSISQKYYTTIWVNIDANLSPSCAWQSYSASSNCEYLNSILDQIIFSYKRAGVFTSSSIWKSIFGSQECQNVAQKSVLWYAYYNNAQSFDDYKQIGGWSQPSMKQYLGNYKLCEINVNRNWQP